MYKSSKPCNFLRVHFFPTFSKDSNNHCKLDDSLRGWQSGEISQLWWPVMIDDEYGNSSLWALFSKRKVKSNLAYSRPRKQVSSPNSYWKLKVLQSMLTGFVDRMHAGTSDTNKHRAGHRQWNVLNHFKHQSEFQNKFSDWMQRRTH